MELRDLYLSGGTRWRTTTGEDDLGPGSDQSDGLCKRRSRGGEGEKKAASREAERGEWRKALDIIRPIAAVPNDDF